MRWIFTTNKLWYTGSDSFAFTAAETEVILEKKNACMS